MKTFLLKLILAAAAVFAVATPLSARADTYFYCEANEVFELSNRIHVRCSNTITLDGDTVRWIAIAKTDADKANRFSSFATAAILSGKSFRVLLPEASTTNVSGCLTSDCRTPVAFGLRN